MPSPSCPVRSVSYAPGSGYFGAVNIGVGITASYQKFTQKYSALSATGCIKSLSHVAKSGAARPLNGQAQEAGIFPKYIFFRERMGLLLRLERERYFFIP